MADRLAKIIQKHVQKAMKDPHDNILMLLDESNIKHCYVLIAGLSYPYRGGEFMFLMDIPDEFPYKPPGFRALTPNEVYEPGPRICISVGEYHARDRSKDGAAGHRPARPLQAFVVEILNGLLCPEGLKGGIGIRVPSPEAREKAAKQSADYNLGNNKELVRKFLELSKAVPDHPAVVRWQRQRAVAELHNFCESHGDAARQKLWEEEQMTVETGSSERFAPNSNKLTRAFSPDFLAWYLDILDSSPQLAAGAFPEGGILCQHCVELSQLDSDTYRKAFVLIHMAAFVDDNTSLAGTVSRLSEHLQCLKPHERFLSYATREKWGAKRFGSILIAILRASMRQSFDTLERLLTALQ